MKPDCTYSAHRMIAILAFALIPYSSGLAAEPTTTNREFIEMQTSLNATMVGVVDWAAHEIWEAGEAENISDRNWLTAKQYAIQLLASGTLVSLGGTGPADRAWVQDPRWQQWTDDMIVAAVEAIEAIDAKDQAQLREVGGRLIETCEGCHADFKPDIPTEGILHVPHHDYGDSLLQ